MMLVGVCLSLMEGTALDPCFGRGVAAGCPWPTWVLTPPSFSFLDVCLH